MKKLKVKTKTVIGYPNEVINVLSDLIQKGEVNVVFFSHYEMFSPDELEKQLSERVSPNGWECDCLYLGDRKDCLYFHRQGEKGITIEDVFKSFYLKNHDIQMVFPEGMEVSLCDSIYDFVVSTVPEFIEEGLSKEDVLWEEHIWDCVDRVEDEYLEGEVQDLFRLYREKEDWTLMDYTYGVLYDQMEQEYDYCKEEC